MCEKLSRSFPFLELHMLCAHITGFIFPFVMNFTSVDAGKDYELCVFLRFFCSRRPRSLPKSKCEENVQIHSHASVWCSKCCKQTIRNSYSTDSAGIEAAELAADLMKPNIARKTASEGIYPCSSKIFSRSLMCISKVFLIFCF